MVRLQHLQVTFQQLGPHLELLQCLSLIEDLDREAGMHDYVLATPISGVFVFAMIRANLSYPFKMRLNSGVYSICTCLAGSFNINVLPEFGHWIGFSC